jgi:hypothetical protein
MSTRTQLTTTPATLTVKNRKVKGVCYSDGTYSITLIQMKSDKQARVCWKCGGTGYLPEYGNVFEGVCFNCNGSGLGHVYDTKAKAMDAVRRNLAKQRTDTAKAEQARIAAEAAQAQREAAWDAWLPGNTDVVEFVADAYSNDSVPFLNRMHEILYNSTPLSENQTAAVRKMMAEQDAQRFGGQPGEKITFTGKIVKTFSGASDYGLYYMVVVEGIDTFSGVTFKMTGTSKLHIELQDCEDDIVTIAATVKKHDLYNGTKQTVMLRPKLISQETPVTPEMEMLAETGEPQWAGIVEVCTYGHDTYEVYPVNGTADAWKLLTDLDTSRNVTHAVMYFYGAEWQSMSFYSRDFNKHGNTHGKLYNLLDENNSDYAVTDYKSSGKPMYRLSLEEQLLMSQWREAFAALQMHVQERGHGTHRACQVSGVQRWGCPEWIELNKPVEELEKKMQEADMAAPYAVLERPAR